MTPGVGQDGGQQDILIHRRSPSNILSRGPIAGRLLHVPPLANAPRQPGMFCLLGAQSNLLDVLVACCETNPLNLLT